MFSCQNYLSYNEVNLANYAHACFDKDIAEIASKAITTNLLLQLSMNEIILLEGNLLNQVEKLSTCEAKLINKINNFNYVRYNKTNHTIHQKNISLSNRVPTNRISLFMINWSNKFVVTALLIISAIALSKQAWA